MGVGDGKSAGNKLMVQRLKALLRPVGNLRNGTLIALKCSRRENSSHRHGAGIDFVKGQPVFHFILIAGKDGLAIVEVEAHQTAIRPAVVFFH